MHVSSRVRLTITKASRVSLSLKAGNRLLPLPPKCLWNRPAKLPSTRIDNHWIVIVEAASVVFTNLQRDLITATALDERILDRRIYRIAVNITTVPDSNSPDLRRARPLAMRTCNGASGHTEAYLPARPKLHPTIAGHNEFQ